MKLELNTLETWLWEPASILWEAEGTHKCKYCLLQPNNTASGQWIPYDDSLRAFIQPFSQYRSLISEFSIETAITGIAAL